MNPLIPSFESNIGLLLALPVFLSLFFIILRRGVKRQTINFLLIRSVIVLLILAALCEPFYSTEQKIYTGSSKIIILVDNSTSMDLFDTSVSERIYSDIKNLAETFNENISTGNKTLDVEMRYFSAGNSTAIGDALYEFAGSKNSQVILISDGNNNEGRSLNDVVRALNASGVAIFTGIPKIVHEDAAIFIEGNKYASLGDDYEIKAKIITTSQVNNSDILKNLNLTVYVDGKLISADHFRFERTGVHKIDAHFTEIDNNDEFNSKFYDYFKINNNFTKTVYVTKKPEILLLTAKNEFGNLRNIIENYYTTISDTPALALSKNITDIQGTGYKYEAIIIDDMESSSFTESDVDFLKQYVEDGGGLVVIGGRNSYDRGNYKGSYVETLLPVQSSTEQLRRSKRINILFLIDISGSTGESLTATTKIDQEKALAIDMINKTARGDYIGVMVFRETSDEIVNVNRYPLQSERDAIFDKISRLKFGGGTYLYSAQQRAETLLNIFEGTKYLIVISDGKVRNLEKSIEIADWMAEAGIKTYAIGVGFDTDEAFMKSLAKSGGGEYFKPEESEHFTMVMSEV